MLYKRIVHIKKRKKKKKDLPVFSFPFSQQQKKDMRNPPAAAPESFEINYLK